MLKPIEKDSFSARTGGSRTGSRIARKGWNLLAPLFLLMVPIFAGCTVDSINIRQGEAIPVTETVVFGRVSVTTEGRSTSLGGSSKDRLSGRPGEFNLVILGEGSTRSLGPDLFTDGTFYWHLAPGNYFISAFQWKRGSGGWMHSGPLKAEFHVPPGDSSVYIGTLRIDFDGNRYRRWIEDDFGEARERLAEIFPDRAAKTVRSLMTVEDLR